MSTATLSGTPVPDDEYVTFDLAGARYAFPMSRVQEIIRMPAVVGMPFGPPCLEGLADLRGRVLPVVSLRRCCDMDRIGYDDTTRVIVVCGGVPLGFVVDRVAGVIGVDPARLDTAGAVRPAVRSDVLIGVIKATGGDLTTVLDVDRLIGTQFSRSAGQPGAEPPGDEEPDDTLDLVSFTVGGQEYALPIDQVQEIVRVPEPVSHVPNADSRVLGVIGLRGRLLPVVSMRRVFGLPMAPLEPGNRVIVVSLDGCTVGLVTDTVREVLRVPRPLVAPLPAVVAGDGRGTEVESVCRLEDGERLVSVLSVTRMFDSPEVRGASAGHQEDEDAAACDDEARV